MADPIGIDFGGSGIKAAPVDLSTGEFSAERERIDTPEQSSPKAVAEVMAELLERFEGSDSAVGVTIPGVVRKGGVVASAANIDKCWIGTDADDLLSDELGREVHVINDADAAGLAEARFGVARGREGLIIVTTLGTGIGSALLYDGVLVPNTELGHLEIEGHDAESRAANSARKNEELSWEKWAKRLTTYYRTLEKLFSPDLIVVGGGVSKHGSEFIPLIEIDTEIISATLRNTAGIVGAAALASDKQDALSSSARVTLAGSSSVTRCAPPRGSRPVSTASWSIAASSSSVSGGPSQRVEVGVELLHRGRSDHRRGDPLVPQRPLQRQLGQLLATLLRDLVERAHVGEGRLVEVVPRDACCRCGQRASPRARRRGSGP